jgi:hypothetical protein
MNIFKYMRERTFINYDLFGFSYLIIPHYCKNVVSSFCPRHNHIKKETELSFEDDHIPTVPPPSPSITPIQPIFISDITYPSKIVRNMYINELIYKYIYVTCENVSVNSLKYKYNYFRTTKDVRQLKIDINNFLKNN